MSITNNVLLNWYYLMEKKLRKLRMIFDIENWLWKSNFGTLWHLPVSPINKIQKFPPAWKLDNPYCHSTEGLYYLSFQRTSLKKDRQWKTIIHQFVSEKIFVLCNSLAAFVWNHFKWAWKYNAMGATLFLKLHFN